MFTRTASFAFGSLLGLSIGMPVAWADSNSLAQTPLFVTESVPPLVMLVLGKDHSLFFEAYNDASDLDEDGELDLQFKPSIQYYGLFDSTLCYTQTGGSATSGYFRPTSATSASAAYVCNGSKEWSGNWLNYITTSRVDALRKVLYGGYRDVDTASQTILRRAYIPQDGHSWAKEYTSIAVNGYDIAQYTPLSAPTSATKRHFFGNLTRNYGTNCATLSNCSDLAPVLSVVTNSTNRVWDWASSERPVLSDTNNLGSGSRTDYTVRVEVCTSSFHDNDCQAYGSHYKPVGLLHQYVDGSMLFGLLTGSYDQNMSGGVLRKVMSDFANEVDSSTGTFTTNNTIVSTLNNLRIRGYQNGSTAGSYGSPSRTRIMNQGEFVDWGNPIGEMMYEALRYLAGKGTPTGTFTTSSTQDTAVGLSRATWDNPYSSNSSAQAAACAKPNMLVMSNVNTSYDSDQLPGSYFGSFSGDLSGLDVSTQATAITSAEGSIAGNTFFIGESGTTSDYAPTAKTITSLAQVRGLSPEEPTKQGSYYPASIARFGATTVVNSASEKETDTYVVALASPLPSFAFTVAGKTVSLVPFAKTTAGNSTNNAKGQYQPTDPIVDLYVESYSSTGAVFRINYEIDEQGNDFDSDMIVKYEITTSNGQLVVKVTPESSSTGGQQHAGYVISGTNRDGTYLVVQDKKSCASTPYFLNVPPGRSADYCNYSSSSSMPSDCSPLPYVYNNSCSNGGSGSGTISTQTFSPGSTTAASRLRSPLWYAAKYGIADRAASTISGDPDNFFLVTNASTLKDQLTSAFNNIQQRNNSVTAPKVVAESSTSSGTYVYTTAFDVENWSGNLRKINTSTKVQAWSAATTLSNSSGHGDIYFNNGDGSLSSFTWGNLNTAQKALLNKNESGTTDTQGEARVNFIRGSNSSFRSRSTLLGDIINSSPLLVSGANYSTSKANTLENSSTYASYKSAQEGHSTVYVGSNDGMLHAFNATDGSERFAFIPSAVIKNLPILTAADYGEEGGTDHHYFVDGTPVARDVYFGGAWHKVLLGSLGAGGRSVFALDVTTPDSPSLLWEFSSADDSDMGYSVPTPGIFRLHTGEWAALVPNGYDSGSSNAVLFVINIETGELISKLTATPTLTSSETASMDSLANGLSRVMGFDANNDGIVDYAYAGDLLGNLWRFDLIDTGADVPLTDDASASDFSVAFGGSPLYVARNADGVRQPITAAPLLTRHPTGLGYLVSFGTGRYLTVNDKASEDQQTLYAIWDRKTSGQATSSSLTADKTRTDLTQQTLSETTNNNTAAFTLTSNTITWYDGSDTADSSVGQWGWYLDFIQTGERLVYNMRMLGNTQLLSTIIPSDDPCEAGVTGNVYGINPKTGGATPYATFDLDGDGSYEEGIAGFSVDGGDFTISDGSIYVNDGDGADGTASYDVNSGLSEGRQTWRQLPIEEN